MARTAQNAPAMHAPAMHAPAMHASAMRRGSASKRASARTWLRAVPLLLAACGIALCVFVAGSVWAQGGDIPERAAVIPGAGPWPRAAQWIFAPWATVALLVAGCLLLYHDLLTPKTWGVTGTLGVLCVGLVFAAHVTVGGFGWVGVVLLLLGLAAVLLEVHAIPGHGAAFGGFMLMFVGMFLSLGGTHHTAFALSVSLGLILASGVAFLAYLPKSPAWQKLGEQMHPAVPRFAAEHETDAAESAPLPIGASGRTITALRPSGRADFAGLDYFVVTEGDFLEAGERIIVSEIDGERVVVESAAPSVSPPSEVSRDAGGVTAG